MNELDELTRRAVSSPVGPPPPTEQLRERVRRNRSRRWARRIVATGCVVVLGVLLVTTVVTGSDNAAKVAIGGVPSRTPTESTDLDEPPLGRVRSERLSDGTSVWIVHHRDDTVSVLSATSPYAPYGLHQLVGWCAAARGFEDGISGSAWDEDGRHIGGPAPTDLPAAPTKAASRGRLRVGRLEPTTLNSALHPTNGGPHCFSNEPTGYDVGINRKLPTYTRRDAVTIDQITPDTPAAADSRVQYVPGAALVVAPVGTVRLCPRKQSEQHTVCNRGPLVVGIDASALREATPAAFQLIEGDMLLRQDHDTVSDITFVHGYTIETFTPSS